MEPSIQYAKTNSGVSIACAVIDGFRSVPTLVIEGYGAITEPCNEELARILEID